MASWQSVYAVDCKPTTGRLDSYTGLQISKLDVGIINESSVADAGEPAFVYREQE